MANPSKDTAKVINEGAELARLTSSHEWQYAKKYLNDMFVQLDSWSTLPDTFTQDQKVKEMEARQAAIALVQQWVATIEGKADQSLGAAKMLIDRDNTSSVYRYISVKDEPGLEI